MIPVNLSKDQAGLVWRLLKKMMTDYEMKQDKELIAIMDRIVPVHDDASHATSRCRFLFSQYQARLLWSTLKIMIDDGIVTDTGTTTSLIDIMTVLAVSLDQENEG